MADNTVCWRSFSTTFGTGLHVQNSSTFASLILFEHYSINWYLWKTLNSICEKITEMDREVSGVFLIYFLRSGRVHTSNNYAVLGLRRHVVSNFWQCEVLNDDCEISLALNIYVNHRKIHFRGGGGLLSVCHARSYKKQGEIFLKQDYRAKKDKKITSAIILKVCNYRKPELPTLYLLQSV